MNASDGYPSLAALIAAKATIVLLVGFVVSFLLRNRSASARHVPWALTFVFVLLVPGVAYLSFAQQAMSIPVAVLSTGASGPEIAPSLSPLPAPLPRVPIEPRSEPRISRTPSASIPWAFLAASLWAVGSLILVSRLALGLASSFRVRVRSVPIHDSAWIDLLDGARERLGVRGPLALRRSEQVQLPLTLGLFRPAILLPCASEEYSVSRRSAVILHELAHVRRRDCLTQFVSQVAAAAFWWNPLVWIASRQMRLLSERASDDLVLHTGARPADYAHDLLEMARGLHKERSTPLGSVTMAHRSRFEERLLAILDPRVARQSVSPRFVLAAGLGVSPMVLSLALAVPTAATPPAVAVSAQEATAAKEAERSVPAEPATRAQAPTEQEEPQEADEPQEPEPRPRSAEEIAALEVAKAALAEALDDPEASVREQALEALVHMGDASVAPYLEKALTDESPRARAQAVWALGQMRREDSVGRLEGALRDPDEEVREQAAWALGMIRARSSVAGLVGALADGSDDVRSQAVWALGMIRSVESVDGLVGALSDSSPEVRSQAAWALGMIRDPRAIQGLSRALKDEDADVREQAAWALGVIALGAREEEASEPELANPNPQPNDPSSVGIEGAPGASQFVKGASF